MTNGKLTDHQWSDIRPAYEGEEPNVSALARQYGISRALLQQRASTQGWVKGGATTTVKARSPARAPTSGPDRREENEEETGFTPGVKTRVLLRHQRECRRLDELIWAEVDTLAATAPPGGLPRRRWATDEDEPSSLARERLARARIDNLHRISQVLATKQRSEREAYRIDPTMTPEPDPVSAEKRARAVAVSIQMLDTFKSLKARGTDLGPFDLGLLEET